jgi:RNA-directed DNA polymerase
VSTARRAVRLEPSELGTPQGGPLSPLLTNILLDDLDRELETRGHRFARYADDLLVLVKSERAGQRVKASLTAYLDRRLKLPVNEQKSRVAPIDQCVFLDFTFRRGKLRRSDAAFEDGTGRMAAPACAHVLLEAVAAHAHEGAPASGAGYRQACRHTDRDQ